MTIGALYFPEGNILKEMTVVLRTTYLKGLDKGYGSAYNQSLYGHKQNWHEKVFNRCPSKDCFRNIHKDYKIHYNFNFSWGYYIRKGSFWTVFSQQAHFQILTGNKYSEASTLIMSNPVSSILEKSALEGSIWKSWKHE